EAEHDVGVQADPGERDQRLQDRGRVVAAPPEGHAPQGELRYAGPLAHEREEAEDQRARGLANANQHDRLDQAQTELGPDGPDDPAGWRDIGAEPDPELLPR